jgi:hypothetical protein
LAGCCDCGDEPSGSGTMELVLAVEKTHHIFIIRISFFKLFEEVISVYTENHRKSISTLYWQNAGLLTVKACSTFSYH